MAVNPSVVATHVGEQGVLACLVAHPAQPKANDAREHPTVLARNLHDETSSTIAFTHVTVVLILKRRSTHEINRVGKKPKNIACLFKDN